LHAYAGYSSLFCCRWSVWEKLLGFAGLIIALLLTTFCLSYYKRFILNQPAA
jgi:predicted PurR-regulated permease PerM